MINELLHAEKHVSEPKMLSLALIHTLWHESWPESGCRYVG